MAGFLLLREMLKEFRQMLIKNVKKMSTVKKQHINSRLLKKSERRSVCCDVGGDVPDRFGHLGINPHEIFNLPDGAQSRCVVAAQFPANIGQRQVGEIAHQIHRDLTRHSRILP